MAPIPFAENDLTSTGLDSGLDKEVSDYVARVGVNSNMGISGLARGRFDAQSAELKYGEVEASAVYQRYSGSLGYTYADKRPSAGINEIRQEITTAAAMKFDQYWAVSGASRFDITGNAFVSGAVALKYDDECFAISLSYTNTRENYSDLDADQTVKLSV
ncbi:LPS assembly protein LptD [uncultured Cohaesibacter sp.]|uniref:LPS assembly protein LptD n=1 Tax=uncultured Cohaesibacter sp. TaxID=1002546 RepID=UPI0029C755EF|nr:LPS assembly protein LptD [uncultured Cohaesibacter sp.]